MARYRKPASIRLIEGNPGKRRIPDDELVGIGRPIAPSTLTAAQLELWDHVVGSLPDGALSMADVSTLERLVVAWDAFREATAVINRDGLTVTGQKHELVRHPALLVRAAMAREMHICGMALGLSPLARTRLAAPERESDDPIAMLVAGASR